MTDKQLEQEIEYLCAEVEANGDRARIANVLEAVDTQVEEAVRGFAQHYFKGLPNDTVVGRDREAFNEQVEVYLKSRKEEQDAKQD